MKAFRLSFIGIILLIYSSLAILGWIGMSHAHNHDMLPMEHCPFMADQQTLCTMGVIEHISAFESLIQILLAEPLILPIPFTLLLLILSLLCVKVVAYRCCCGKIREDFYASLFSRGILNPKVP